MSEWVTFETNPETWPEPIHDGFSTVFERPDELVDGFEDTENLAGGSPRDPLNLDGGPPGPEGGAGEGTNWKNIGASLGAGTVLLVVLVAVVFGPALLQGAVSEAGRRAA
jgi:hypothetical protein